LPIEVILVHDVQDSATSGELFNLVSEIENKEVTLLEGEFGSPGLARNFGKKRARAERITFWDSDDIGQPKELLSAIEEFPNHQIIFGNFETVDNHMKSRNSVEIDPKNNLEVQLAENPGIWRFIFDVSLVRDLEFSDLQMGEDQIFLLLTAIEPSRFKHTNRVFYTYFTGNPFQLTENSRSKQKVSIALREMAKIVNREIPISRTLAHAFIAKMTISMFKSCKIKISLSTCYELFGLQVKGNKLSRSKLIKYAFYLILRRWKRR
jgi:glycosyltransferase involved in cell wall biosynthesis